MVVSSIQSEESMIKKRERRAYIYSSRTEIVNRKGLGGIGGAGEV